MDIIIQLVLGALGGNAAGALLKKFNLGIVGNSLAGILGGGIGGQLLTSLGGESLLGGGLGTVLGGAAGGGVLMVVIGVVKNLVAKR